MSSDSASNDISSNGDDSEATGYSTPSSGRPPSPVIKTSTLHDTSRSKYHMKDLSSFVSNLENSAKAAFPNRERLKARYKTVQVLLLRWKDDDLDVCYEVEDLEKVFRRYGFDTETWLIPTENSHLKLMIKAASFVEMHESPDTLFVVYYGGHAMINPARQSTWSCKRDLKYASLEWSAIQTLFEKASSDVLLLLDCCSAASAAPLGGRAMTETIAACGWESIAAEPGRFSFTDALIRVLEEWINKPFTAAMLHSELLSMLKHEKPEVSGTRRIERRRTPIYIVTTSNLKACSIQLSRIMSDTQLPPNDDEKTASCRAQQPSSPPSDTGEVDSLTKSMPNGQLAVPHVLISLALEEDQLLDAEACSEWLSAFPALAKYAKVQSVFKSHSTLLVISVPVMIWDLLPEDSACSFIGYVCSDNLLRNSAAAPQEISVAAKKRVKIEPQLQPSISDKLTRIPKRSFELYSEDLLPFARTPRNSSPSTPVHVKQEPTLEVVKKMEPSFTSFSKEWVGTPAASKPSSKIQEGLAFISPTPPRLQLDIAELKHLLPIPPTLRLDTSIIELLLSSYWENFHPIYPIVHRATFDPNKDTTLCRAMAAIGSQYLHTKPADTDGTQIHEACLKEIDLCSTWKFSTMQAIFLAEIFTLFRGRKITVSASENFKNLFMNITNAVLQFRAVEDPTVGLNISTKHSQDETETSLKAAWTTWLDAESRRRLMHACFVLDTQQAIYHEQLSNRSTLQQPARYLPWLPSPDEVWEATSAAIWASRLSKHKAAKITRVDDRLLVSSIAEDQKLTPFSHLILLCTQFSELPARDNPTYPNGIMPLYVPPNVEIFMPTFLNKSKTNAFLMFYHIPLQDLLAIAGDTWVFGRKISQASAFHAAQSRLKTWSSSLVAAAATQCACRILQAEITQHVPRSAFHAPNDQVNRLEGCISDYWVLYIASLVCWAFGHRYQTSGGSARYTAGGSTFSRNSSGISEPDSAIDVTSSSGYAEARAMEYLKKMLESSMEELLTSSFSARGDTGSVLQVVKLRLEKEAGRSSSGMLSDAIRCLNKVAQSGGKWF